MKKIINNLLIFGLLAMVIGCSDEAVGPVLQTENIEAPVFITPTASASFTLAEGTLTNDFAEFTWSPADYGFDAGVTYTLEMDLAGNNFSEPTTVGNTNGTALKATNVQVNSILLSKSVPDKVLTDVSFRLLAKISDEVDVIISQPITLKIAPVKVKVDYPKVYVPGSYQGWNPADVSTVLFSVKSDKKYEGFIYFGEDNAKFKITPEPNWNSDFGDNGQDGTLEAKGSDIDLAGPAGLYKLNVNLNALTITKQATNWGLIGSGTPTGWDSDTDMIYDPVSKTLKVTLALSDGGKIKFRANDAWDINFGDTNGNGSLEYGGDDISVPAGGGTFEIELILNTGDYTYKLTKK